MQTRIRFKAYGSSTVFGSFGPGDRLACSQELARHLVEQAGVAEYEVPPQAVGSDSGEVAVAAKPAARRGRKAAAG